MASFWPWCTKKTSEHLEHAHTALEIDRDVREINTSSADLIYSNELMIITTACVSGEAALTSGRTSDDREQRLGMWGMLGRTKWLIWNGSYLDSVASSHLISLLKAVIKPGLRPSITIDQTPQKPLETVRRYPRPRCIKARSCGVLDHRHADSVWHYFVTVAALESFLCARRDLFKKSHSKQLSGCKLVSIWAPPFLNALASGGKELSHVNKQTITDQERRER